MSFFEELKRRNVFRVGIAYAVTAWVLLQVLDLVLEHTETPAWVMDVFFAVVVLGFIVALVIAWAYEMTPEGIKKEADVDRSDSVTHETSKKLDKITLVALGLVVILILVDRFVTGNEATDPATRSATMDTVQQETEVAPAAEEQLERGIAVLPFSNLSEDEGNAFFAGGVHEDVLTNLARIQGLRVISRTSMLRIAERGMEISEIGRHLGVSHVLEGSVRRAGDQVRVTVQLIDAAEDVHLWAENYDRKLDDIFAIQSEIAQQIARQLETEMSAEAVARLDEVPTTNLDAYDLFSRAREMRREWRGAQGFIDVLPLLEKAVSLDPDFLNAQIFLSRVYGRLLWTGVDPKGIYRVKARESMQLIEQKWPFRPETAFARGDFHYTIERDYESALEDYLQALPSLPNDTYLLMQISSSYKRLGRFEEGLEIAMQAHSLDPEFPSVTSDIVYHTWGTGKIEETLEVIRRAIEKFPGNWVMMGNQGWIRMSQYGDKQAFLDAGDGLVKSDPPLGFGNRIQFSNLSVMGSYLQLKVNKNNIDQWLERIESTLEGAGAFRIASAHRISALLLEQVGQKTESADIAASALNAVQSALAAGDPIPSNTPEINYSELASLACLAGDQAAFNQYSMVVRSLKPAELVTKFNSNYIMALATAGCGDMDTAWQHLLDSIHVVFGETEWSVALDPVVKRRFSDYPPFQELVRILESEKAASE